MRAIIPKERTLFPLGAEALQETGDWAKQVIEPLMELARSSDALAAGSVGELIEGRGRFQIPRFIFTGPRNGGDSVRLAIFAAIHGDETEGTEALVEFLRDLDQVRPAAKGWDIYAYPICNPTGVAAGTRKNAAGADLAAHFWRGSPQPEVYYLEREIGIHRFEGIISLHVDAESRGFTACTPSPILKDALVGPAIEATRAFLPGSTKWDDDGRLGAFPAAYPRGFLTATDELRPAPFEINLGIPGRAPHPSQIHGTVAALKAVLDFYRRLHAYRQNI